MYHAHAGPFATHSSDTPCTCHVLTAAVASLLSLLCYCAFTTVAFFPRFAPTAHNCYGGYGPLQREANIELLVAEIERIEMQSAVWMKRTVAAADREAQQVEALHYGHLAVTLQLQQMEGRGVYWVYSEEWGGGGGE